MRTNWDRLEVQRVMVAGVVANEPVTDELVRLGLKKFGDFITAEDIEVWLNQEYIEPIKISQFEYGVLKGLSYKLKWLVRLQSGALGGIEGDDEPIRDQETNIWQSSGNGLLLEDLNPYFQFVKLGDKAISINWLLVNAVIE